MCACDRRFFLAMPSLLALAPARASEIARVNTAMIAEAFRMRDLAISTGDQAYGAIVALDGAIIGLGPSRVVQDRDPDAHAERVAIREAQSRVSADAMRRAILVSTSRACGDCERAAYRASIARMYFGPEGRDAGAPRNL